MGLEQGLREASSFREMLHARRFGTADGFQLPDKIQTYEIIRNCGGTTPKVIGVYPNAKDIKLNKLPDRFVLKPSDLAAARGVYILNRIAGDNGYWCMMNRQRYWGSQIVSAYEKWKKLSKQRRNKDLYFIAEEVVVSPQKGAKIPLDYKFYTFNGRVEFILQIDRNTSPITLHFYDGEFNDLSWEDALVLGDQKKSIGEAIPPNDKVAMLEMASAVSRKLRTPFVSVDMFESNDGPIIGELTAAPGGPYFGSLFLFNAGFDAKLAKAWLEAAEELQVRKPMVRTNETIPMRSEAMPSKV